jgi:hypothetical protein
MPLTRLNDSAFDAQLEGVYFGMWNGSMSVRCLVTHGVPSCTFGTKLSSVALAASLS